MSCLRTNYVNVVLIQHSELPGPAVLCVPPHHQRSAGAPTPSLQPSCLGPAVADGQDRLHCARHCGYGEKPQDAVKPKLFALLDTTRGV